MTDATADYTSAPHNYEDMHRLYFSYIVKLCGTCGIADENREDVASDIFLRLMERQFHDQFDPELVFEYKGQARPARFKSFLSSVVMTYVRGHYDKQVRIQRREVQIIDQPVLKSGSLNPGTGREVSDRTWLDVSTSGIQQPDHAEDVLDKVMEESNAAAVRSYLADIPARSSHDRCDLPAVYNAVRAQILEYGVYDVNILADHFGVGSTAMYSWLWWLKENLAELYGLPVPPRRPRNLKAA